MTTPPIRQSYEPIHHTIVLLDIDGFGRETWTDRMQADIRDALYGTLDQAMRASGISADRVELRSDLGDGVLLLLRDVSTARLLSRFARELASRLAAVNKDGLGPLKLRMAVHASEVVKDANGYTGRALILARRLLDADDVRGALRRVPGTHLVVVVSKHVWDHIVIQGFDDIDPAAYWPIQVRSKETNDRAWVSIPEDGPR